MISYQSSSEFAQAMDALDPLAPMRNQFYFPRINGKEALYFCGNSLGLQPKSTEAALLQELEDWKNWGVEGHFHAKNPWFPYHKILTASLARIVGGNDSEVVCMNTLTVNLHLLMVSFYRPTTERYKIIMEAGAFPSDQYAIESQVRFHGFAPDDAIIEIAPREGEHTLRTDDILTAIETYKDSLALVMFGGVQYFTGQRFDMQVITSAAHTAGAIAGFDLAHAIGNVELELHNWNVDFAAWCSYKYLNSGPGGVGGIFVHDRYAESPDLPRFAGWWGNDEATRFEMKKGFHPARGAEGWQISNAQVFQMAALRSSLSIFDMVELPTLFHKRDELTGYLKFLIDNIIADFPELSYTNITPANPFERGSQISFLVGKQGRKLHNYLTDNGVIVDWREPNVVRIAPVPLYNSFEDVFRLSEMIRTYSSYLV
ncbi:MAG: kynureninase [Bacteroidetes bacterium]|nr:kynureninase [Bacteroidota bacterium]